MKLVSQPLLGLCSSIEPTVTRLQLTATETALLSRAAVLMDEIKDAIQERFGENTAGRDPWIDLALGASGIRDVLELVRERGEV